MSRRSLNRSTKVSTTTRSMATSTGSSAGVATFTWKRLAVVLPSASVAVSPTVTTAADPSCDKINARWPSSVEGSTSAVEISLANARTSCSTSARASIKRPSPSGLVSITMLTPPRNSVSSRSAPRMLTSSKLAATRPAEKRRMGHRKAMKSMLGCNALPKDGTAMGSMDNRFEPMTSV